jgi:alkyl hydroperoxide reductase subunit AhpC
MAKNFKKNAGIEGITFPLISDPRRTLSKKLKILGKDNVTYRATYLIDENNLVYYESINEMSIGRNIDELLRIIDAKIHHDLNGEVCPANWILGKKALKESTESVKKYFSNLK